MWRPDYGTYNLLRSSNRRVNLVKQLISIAIMLRIVGSTFSLVGSGRRSIVAARNGPQLVGGCNPLLKVVLSL